MIECKEERVTVSAQQVIEQAAGYAYCVGARYIIVTNGVEMYYYHYNEKYDTYEDIDGLLSYQDMINDNFTVTKNNHIFTRVAYEDYYDIGKLKQTDWAYEKIGEDTKDELIPTIINLDDCLLDTSCRLERLPSKTFEVIADLGIQFRSYGDASGGGFGSGFYRVIHLKNKELNKDLMVGFTIITTGKMINEQKYGTSDGKSVFIIMKNDGDRDEMSVQINMNKCVTVKETKSTFTHNALITTKGKTKQGLLEYIHLEKKELVEGKHIMLGTLDCSKSLFMNSEDVSKFLSNAIEYAVYRDEYKNS